jgi:hypothetical protein
VLKSPKENRLLVAEGGIKAGRSDFHRLGKIIDGSRVVPLFPKKSPGSSVIFGNGDTANERDSLDFC